MNQHQCQCVKCMNVHHRGQATTSERIEKLQRDELRLRRVLQDDENTPVASVDKVDRRQDFTLGRLP